MPRWIVLALVVALTGVLAPAATRAADPEPKAELAAKARNVLNTYCYRCHGLQFEYPDYNVLDLKSLLNPSSIDTPYVAPGQADKSYLFLKMVKGSMPPRDQRERPNDDDKAVVKKWIEAGAPPFPTAVARPFVGLKAVLTAIRDDLRKADKPDRAYLRYFTLTHLYNNPKIADADLRVYRAALSKAVNSLSWKPRVVLPRAVDDAQTVFAVDVRDLDWEKGDLWNEILKQYPYGLRHDGSHDVELRQLDEDVADLSDCDTVPYVRADWFAATAMRPPLYQMLLQLPATAGELERRLGVDVRANFLADKLARAGFAASGVSEQKNRLLERHEAPFGAYWKSYDFRGRTRHSTLTRYPLGPLFADNPYPRMAFEQAGGEIIFTLPNGLQGYLLVNGKDERIDAGPTDVVSDALKTSGTTAIVTGVSCMACHKHGMIHFQDQIRDGTAVGGDAFQKVQRLYPSKKVMDELVRGDEERFVAALEKAVGPFLRVGEDKDKAVRDFAEPVGEIARLYGLIDVDAAGAALELGVEKPDQLAGMVKGDKKLRELGLGPLADGGALKRDDWEDLGEGYSLFQMAARELEFGTPVKPK